MITDRIAKAFRAPYDPHEELPWWMDNLGHFASGIVLGGVLWLLTASWVYTTVGFVTLAIMWETFEYYHNVRPWDERERGSWPTDRAIEDTLLDTYIGLTGAQIGAYVLHVLF